MKLAGAAAARWLARPEPGRAGVLIFGADAMKVALKRQHVIAALIGPEGEAEMRLTRMSGADLRRDPALVSDALRAVGFFPGPRVAFVEEATDGLADVLGAALKDWRDGDATLVVTAGALTAKSALRKPFEAHQNALAIGLYDDPLSREEIDAELRRAGVAEIDRAGMGALLALAAEQGPGDFRKTLEKLALYKLGDAGAVTPEDVAAVAPASIDAGVDDVAGAVADGRAGAVGPLLTRAFGQGIAPVTLVIGLTRHFRQLHAAATMGGPPADAVGRLRPPPPFGAKRDRMVRQVQSWGAPRLESALSLLVDTDLALRSTSRAPAAAVLERALIRVAMMAPKA